MKFADQDGVFREATAEDLLKMAGVTPPESSEGELADRFDAMEAQQEEAEERLNDARYEAEDIREERPSTPERVANISSTVNPYQRRDLSLELVQRYLPSNYSSYEYVGPDGEEMIQIRGRDNAGWTLDGYVIPRLASADIYAREVE